MTVLPLAWNMPGLPDWIVIAVVALLLFGRRLPEVGRSLGKGIVEFKKGLRGIEDDLEDATTRPAARPNESNPAALSGQQARQVGEPNTLPPAQGEYKYDPYTGKPIQSNQAGNA